MELSSQILSDITVFSKYARYLPDQRRRETWEEIVSRNKEMHKRRFPKLVSEIDTVWELVRQKKVLPSARALQFGGRPIELNLSRSYNCSFLPIDSWEAFHEIMFLLLGGTGVGWSVQRHHIARLPELKMPNPKRTRRFLVNDSIEGWADAIKGLMKNYFLGGSTLEFDFSDIRPRGSPLITAGGRAPGPQPLKDCIHNLRKILDTKSPGDRLAPLEAHDMGCFIADCVLAGGIRRSACISLFSIDDEDMLACKTGHWAELSPQRARANNSAVILRHRIREKRFLEFWERVKTGGTGEPGLILSNNQEYGFNPCSEASLRPYSFCNLTTVNTADIESQADLEIRSRAAAFIGTLQASYTDFHYLREIWRETTEKDALLGVGLAGIASGAVLKYDLKKAAAAVLEENKRVAKLIGIRPTARATLVKPDGTVSLVLGTSSGIHAWHAPYYIRRIRLLKNEPLYRYLKRALPSLVEDEYYKPTTEAVLSVPIKAPDGAVCRSEGPISLLRRVERVYNDWVLPGHVDGDNTHNISATVSIQEHEWDKVGRWMWEHRDSYTCLAVLPHAGGSYRQLPHEEIDEETYTRMEKNARLLDLAKVSEEEDLTTLAHQVACAGDSCALD